MRKIIIFLMLLIPCSCNQLITNKTSKYNEKDYVFSLKTISTDYEKNKSYSLILPKGKKEKIYPQNGEIYVEYRINYKDSSIFYISNDIWNLSQVNIKNLIKIGVNSSYKKDIIDTIVYSGMQGNGNFWKEVMLGEIVVGYSNASPEKKEKFDDAISSVKK